MHALVLLHHAADAPGAVARSLADRGVALRTVATHQGDAVPDSLGDARALVVMGGPMAASDDARFPNLPRERALLARAVDAGVPVLGVCLGAQLLAMALGGGVALGVAREVGWHEVERAPGAEDDPLFATLGARFTPFHWHADSIVAPPGAARLASSPVTRVQAFRAGSAYGVQFHLESDAAMVETMARDFASELRAGEGEALARATRAHLAEQERLASLFFGRWADAVVR